MAGAHRCRGDQLMATVAQHLEIFLINLGMTIMDTITAAVNDLIAATPPETLSFITEFGVALFSGISFGLLMAILFILGHRDDSAKRNEFYYPVLVVTFVSGLLISTAFEPLQFIINFALMLLPPILYALYLHIKILLKMRGEPS